MQVKVVKSFKAAYKYKRKRYDIVAHFEREGKLNNANKSVQKFKEGIKEYEHRARLGKK